MRISADSGSCISAGVCVGMAPEHFDQDDDEGTVLVIEPLPSPATERAVRLAAEACPVRAIHLVE